MVKEEKPLWNCEEEGAYKKSLAGKWSTWILIKRKQERQQNIKNFSYVSMSESVPYV